MNFVLASKNRHKLQEMSAILNQYGVQVSLQGDHGVDIELEETGSSFEEYARLKARAVMEVTCLPAIADDSGLEVDALDGAPGIYSARYGGEQCANDVERYEYLLKNLEAVPPEGRTARFVCVIAAVFPDGRKILARGCCEGTITFAPRGADGFGYDPVFYVPQEGCTFAELSSEQKNEISHRANALRLFQKKVFEV